MEIGPYRNDQPPALALNQASTPEELASRRELIQAVKAINHSFLFGRDSELTYAWDRQNHRTVVRLVDRRTGEVIRQIPSEETLRLAQTLRETSPDPSIGFSRSAD